MPDTTYQTKVSLRAGGDELAVKTGGKITADGTQAAAIANVTGTADATYSANETTMINDLQAALNAVLAALRGVGIIAT